jgi:hypothetical protein
VFTTLLNLKALLIILFFFFKDKDGESEQIKGLKNYHGFSTLPLCQSSTSNSNWSNLTGSSVERSLRNVVHRGQHYIEEKEKDARWI